MNGAKTGCAYGKGKKMKGKGKKGTTGTAYKKGR